MSLTCDVPSFRRLARELEEEEFDGFKGRRDFEGIRAGIARSKEEAARIEAEVRMGIDGGGGRERGRGGVSLTRCCRGML